MTPSPLATWARILIGAVAEVAFLCYALVLGRRASVAGQTPDMENAPDELPVTG